MKNWVTIFALVLSVGVSAQTLEERYRSFQQSAQQAYSDFRDEANHRYADFMRAAWEYYAIGEAVKAPKETPVPPVVYVEPEVEPEPAPIPYEEIIPQPEPAPQPEPVSPIIENKEQSSVVKIVFYGTPMEFRYPKLISIKLKSTSGDELANAWEILSGDEFDNLVYDCLQARKTYDLCDWAYVELLGEVSEKIFGKTNEAVFLQAFLYTQSGYAMHLAQSKAGKLYMLIGSSYIIYERGYFEIDGMYFFPLEDVEDGLMICSGEFDKVAPMTLSINPEQKLASKPSDDIVRKSDFGITAHCTVNKNMIDFFNSYPTGQIGGDAGTRWAMYANMPLEKSVQQTLYPTLMQAVRGVPEAQAVNKLLNWVQTAFEYEYDDKVWGGDRAFFPSESLYYPYCDCEDRSILFSRIIRDLLGLDVVLLYYPGHLATAVNFHQDVKGDYLVVDGKKYVVCDPTYIGAPIGYTMPGMDNKTAMVVKLKK